jgi:predicted transcriptional regulator
MKNQELILREILYKAIEEKKYSLTQSELSKKLNISLSIVNSTIKKLDSIGALKIEQRSFKILDIKKILYFWASTRNLEKDIIFKTRINAPVREIERIMPEIVFTAFTAYKFMFKDVPADYSEVYLYADEKELEIIKKRISKLKTSPDNKNPNLIILKQDCLLNFYKKIPLAQLFVDLWNIREWYAKEFLNSLENKIKELK